MTMETMRRQKPFTFASDMMDGGGSRVLNVVPAGPPRRNRVPEYIERQAVLGLLAAAQDQQDEMARQEEEKAAGSIPTITKHRHAAELMADVANAVWDLPAAPVKEEKEV